MRRAWPWAVALLGLLGALFSTFSLFRAASRSLDQEFRARLLGAGESASLLLGDGPPSRALMQALRDANGLDGAYVVSPALKVLADSAGSSGRVDLLRTDPVRVKQALAGQMSVGPGYQVESLEVTTGYFPVKGKSGVSAVLALEAGQAFAKAKGHLVRALWVGIAISFAFALALAVLALRWMRAERLRREGAERAARGDALAKMAAAAAHEIRNPLGVIRGNIELLEAKGGRDPRDQEAFRDVLGEVERLKQLTEDFLDLAADRPLSLQPVDVRMLLEATARTVEGSQPGFKVQLAIAEGLTANGDPQRLRQVLLNLLQNAAQAGAGTARLIARREGARLRVRIEDDGPGIPEMMREKLFEPFVTSKAKGTGIGLSVSRRLIERHGGTLVVAEAKRGAAFELTLLPVQGS